MFISRILDFLLSGLVINVFRLGLCVKITTNFYDYLYVIDLSLVGLKTTAFRCQKKNSPEKNILTFKKTENVICLLLTKCPEEWPVAKEMGKVKVWRRAGGEM